MRTPETCIQCAVWPFHRQTHCKNVLWKACYISSSFFFVPFVPFSSLFVFHFIFLRVCVWGFMWVAFTFGAHWIGHISDGKTIWEPGDVIRTQTSPSPPFMHKEEGRRTFLWHGKKRKRGSFGGSLKTAGCSCPVPSHTFEGVLQPRFSSIPRQTLAEKKGKNVDLKKCMKTTVVYFSIFASNQFQHMQDILKNG